VTSLGFVEYFDSVIYAIVMMLTQNDATERPSTESSQALEIFKSANVLQVPHECTQSSTQVYYKIGCVEVKS